MLPLWALVWLACCGWPASAADTLVLPLTRRDGGTRVRGLLRNATLPLHGAVRDYGYFYAELHLGTPSNRYHVIVDTGSTMTYVPCVSCGSNCGTHHKVTSLIPPYHPGGPTAAQASSCSGGSIPRSWHEKHAGNWFKPWIRKAKLDAILCLGLWHCSSADRPGTACWAKSRCRHSPSPQLPHSHSMHGHTMQSCNLDHAEFIIFRSQSHSVGLQQLSA